MVQLIKGMFNNSTRKKADIDESSSSTFQEFIKIDWYQEGRLKAQSLDSSEAGLLCCIGRIYHNHKEILRKDKSEQERAKRPYIEKRQELVSENEMKKSLIERIRADTIPKLKERVSHLRTEIDDIRKYPEKYTGNRVGKAGYVIGGFILAFLTLYLFIFYSSASFSAFFKTFSAEELAENNIILKSIFDGQALIKAWNDGVQKFIFVLTIPFLFLGLGYIIHKFQEKEGWVKYLKVGTIVIVTFIFDALIAYSIDKGIYNMVRETSFLNPGDPGYLPSHSVWIAITNEKFWLIIFAGFLAYIIWGLVFDFVMEAYLKLDRVSIEVNSRSDEIHRLEKQIEAKEYEINEINENISLNNIKIENLRAKIDHSDIINHKELEHSLMRFLNGWLEVLSFNKKSEEEKNRAHDLVLEFISINIKSLNLEKPAVA